MIIRIASQNAADAAARLNAAEADRDKWMEAFNRSEQFQNGPTKRAEAAESQLAALRAAARHEHERAVGANAMFSVEHWKHNAGQDHPHEPDDDSFIAFENCRHPLCASVRSIRATVEPVRIGAFDYVENADETVTRKDWRDGQAKEHIIEIDEDGKVHHQGMDPAFLFRALRDIHMLARRGLSHTDHEMTMNRLRQIVAFCEKAGVHAASVLRAEGAK